jgi:uncharacterized membrane protein
MDKEHVRALMAHVHLLLNHFPTVGMAVGLGLYFFSLLRNSSELKRASLVVFLGLSLLAIPTYVTGNAAQSVICQAKPEDPCLDPNVSKPGIETHESAALIGFAAMELLGAFAWLGLWQYRRSQAVRTWTTAAVVVLSLATFGLMARAANIGGEIRHPEIRDPQAPTAVSHFAREVGLFVTGKTWMWPTCETLHFIGLTLLLGVVLLLDLRMIGVIKGVSYKTLHRLLPWAILGFGVNTATGMLFFVGFPSQYSGNISFYWKLALVLLAGANALYFTLFDDAWELKPGEDAPFRAKAMAMSHLVLWVGVMYFGSMLPFIGDAF